MITVVAALAAFVLALSLADPGVSLALPSAIEQASEAVRPTPLDVAETATREPVPAPDAQRESVEQLREQAKPLRVARGNERDIRVVDPIDDRVEDVADAIEDLDLLAGSLAGFRKKLADAAGEAVVAGTLRIRRLRLVDGFGQLVDLVGEGAAPRALLWSRRIRLNPLWLWVLAMVINVGMWLERFIIVVTSLHRGFITATWSMYYPTIWDWSTYIGTIGLFLTLLFLFLRFVPAISIFEMRELVEQTKGEGRGGGGAHGPATGGPPQSADRAH